MHKDWWIFLLQIWVSPKKFIRHILKKDPKGTIIWLAAIGGLLSTFLWISLERGVRCLIWGFLLLLPAGSLMGILNLYISGWLYKLTGAWLGGKGSFTEVKCAVGWSYYPFIIASLLNCISLYLLSNPYLQALFGLLNLIMIGWGFVIFLNMLAEAHLFSAWRALLAVMVALILVFLVVTSIILIIPLVTPLF